MSHPEETIAVMQRVSAHAVAARATAQHAG